MYMDTRKRHGLISGILGAVGLVIRLMLLVVKMPFHFTYNHGHGWAVEEVSTYDPLCMNVYKSHCYASTAWLFES
jgi:hypothetical protein